MYSLIPDPLILSIRSDGRLLIWPSLKEWDFYGQNGPKTKPFLSFSTFISAGFIGLIWTSMS